MSVSCEGINRLNLIAFFSEFHCHSHRDILRGLAVVLEDDGDVHVDDDEEADDEVREQVGDRHHRVPAIALVASFWIC